LAAWKNPHVLVSLIQEATYPVESAWHNVMGSMAAAWSKHLQAAATFEENAMLRRELARLQTRIMDYEEQVLENSRLRRLLGFTHRIEKRLVAAEVVSVGGLPPFQTLRVARGSRDG